MNELEALR